MSPLVTFTLGLWVPVLVMNTWTMLRYTPAERETTDRERWERQRWEVGVPLQLVGLLAVTLALLELRHG